MDSIWRAVLVAKDIAPCRTLTDLEKALGLSSGGGVIRSVESFLANGKDYPTRLETMKELASMANVVIVGMSSSVELAREELEVAKVALENNIPVFCYADTFGLRLYFREILSNRLTTLFCINEKQAEQARAKYPDLKVFVVGNPEWEKFFFPKLTREQSREKLGIGLDETVILLPAGKDVVVNILHFSTAIESCAGDKLHHVIISLRPEDSTPLSIYKTLSDFAPDNVKVRIVQASEMSASDILYGADCVISSASTIEIEALCLKVPILVISFLSPLARRRLKKATGSDEWELVKIGVVYEYGKTTRPNLFDSINVWKDAAYDSVKEIYIRKHFPKPEKLGTAIDKMVHAIFS